MLVGDGGGGTDLDPTTPKGAVDRWFAQVTEARNPQAAADAFCEDGLLKGTESGVIRRGRDAIKQYFDYFANVPCLAAVRRAAPGVGLAASGGGKFVDAVTPDVATYNAAVSWTLGGCGDATETVARMTFVLHKEEEETETETETEAGGNYCISLLHSSLPAAVPNCLKCAGGEAGEGTDCEKCPS